MSKTIAVFWIVFAFFIGMLIGVQLGRIGWKECSAPGPYGITLDKCTDPNEPLGTGEVDFSGADIKLQ